MDHAEAPSDVVFQQLAGPIGTVERRIGQDLIGLEVGVKVAEERVGGLGAEVGFDWASHRRPLDRPERPAPFVVLLIPPQLATSGLERGDNLPVDRRWPAPAS